MTRRKAIVGVMAAGVGLLAGVACGASVPTLSPAPEIEGGAASFDVARPPDPPFPRGGPPDASWPEPPLLDDAGVAADGAAACLARPLLECAECEDCTESERATLTLGDVVKRCGPLCGGMIVRFDESGCPASLAVDPNQREYGPSLECVLESLRDERWSCGGGQAVRTNFGGSCARE